MGILPYAADCRGDHALGAKLGGGVPIRTSGGAIDLSSEASSTILVKGVGEAFRINIRDHSLRQQSAKDGVVAFGLVSSAGLAGCWRRGYGREWKIVRLRRHVDVKLCYPNHAASITTILTRSVQSFAFACGTRTESANLEKDGRRCGGASGLVRTSRLRTLIIRRGEAGCSLLWLQSTESQSVMSPITRSHGGAVLAPLPLAPLLE